MGGSEGVAALKGAYAEMIMNTARESAGRVARSEARALRMQRELSTVKAESLRLLLRMKHLIDAKTTEAEIASSSRQDKVNELEAQLHEAEGIIVDLRAELNWIRDKVEKLRNNRLTDLNRKNMKDGELFSQNSDSLSTIPSLSNSQLLTPSIAVASNTFLDQKIMFNNCCIAKEQEAQLRLPHFESPYSSNSEVALETMKNKELGQGRNGFEQKDPSLKGNQLADNLSPAEVVDLRSTMQDSTLNGNYDDGKNFFESCLKIWNVERTEKFLGESRNCLEAPTFKQSKDWFGRDRSNCSSPPNQLHRPYPRPSILSRCRKKYSTDNHCLDTTFRTATGKTVTKNFGEAKEELLCQSSISKDEKETVREGKKQKKVEDQGLICNSFLSHVGRQSKGCQPHSQSLPDGCVPCTSPVHGNVKSGEAQSKMTENGAKLKPLRPGLTLIKGCQVPLSGSGNVTPRSMSHCRSTIAPSGLNKETELACGSVDEKQGTSCQSAVGHCQSNSDHDKVLAPLGSGEKIVTLLSEVSDFSVDACGEPFLFPDEEASNRILKYAFQRKHKKEPLTTLDQNSLPGVATGDRMMEQYGGSFESHKLSLLPELFKDNAQLAQVANQLISLSEKRR